MAPVAPPAVPTTPRPAPAGRGMVVERLDWDTRTFGLAVGRLNEGTLCDADLAAALEGARGDGVRLVYWETDPQRDVSAPLLARFGGCRPATQVNYGAALTSLVPLEDDYGVRIAEVAPSSVCPEPLLRLSLAAGQHSRFQVDPQFPRAGFETLYRLWIERSVRHEIAQIVFAAWSGDEIVGCVTADVRGDTGRIGLIAVDTAARGRGIGRRLMEAAADWMGHSGAARLEVATQRENAEACAFYERLGLRPLSVLAMYHFWL